MLKSPILVLHSKHKQMSIANSRLTALIAVLLLFTFAGSCSVEQPKETTQSEQAEVSPKPQEKNRQPIKKEISTAEGEAIAKFTIASIMGREPDIMKATHDQGVYKVSYIHPDDGTLNVLKIKFTGNQILWGSWEGRWREHKLDAKIFYSQEGNIVTITQRFDDGSSTVDSYSME